MKKKITGLLSILLFTLLLSCFSTTYATSFSKEELQNIMYNCLTNFGDHDKDSVRTALEGGSAIFEEYSQKTTEYNYVTIFCDIITSTIQTNVNYSMTIYLSNRNDKPAYPGNNWCNAYYTIRLNQNSISKGLGGVVNKYMQQNGDQPNDCRYNDLPIYNNSSGTTVVLTSGWHPSNIDEGVFNSYRFIFTYPNHSSYVTIQNDVEPTNYCWISTGYQVFLGTLIDSRYTSEIKHNWAKWNGSQYVYGHYTWDYEYSKNGDIRNVYKNTIVENNEYNTNFYIDTYNHANDILHIAITPQEGYNFGSYELYYYIYNNYTVVQNGSVIPTSTFTGDYQQQYDTQTTTNEIIENIQQNADNVSDTLTDDSQVNNILDDTLSGDKLINDIGFNFVVNPFENFIKTTLQGFTNALLGEGNVVYHIPLIGTSITINSNDFVLPEHPFFDFIHLVLNAFVVYMIAKYGFQLYDWINTGRIQNLLNAEKRTSYWLF